MVKLTECLVFGAKMTASSSNSERSSPRLLDSPMELQVLYDQGWELLEPDYWCALTGALTRAMLPRPTSPEKRGQKRGARRGTRRQARRPLKARQLSIPGTRRGTSVSRRLLLGPSARRCRRVGEKASQMEFSTVSGSRPSRPLQ